MCCNGATQSRGLITNINIICSAPFKNVVLLSVPLKLQSNTISALNKIHHQHRFLSGVSRQLQFFLMVHDCRFKTKLGRTTLTLLHMLSAVPRKEISQILKSSYLRGLNMASFFASSKITVFITFTFYILLGNNITASSVFVTVSLFGTIKLTVTLFFPLAVEKLSETIVSIRRVKVSLQQLLDYLLHINLL